MADNDNDRDELGEAWNAALGALAKMPGVRVLGPDDIDPDEREMVKDRRAAVTRVMNGDEPARVRFARSMIAAGMGTEADVREWSLVRETSEGRFLLMGFSYENRMWTVTRWYSEQGDFEAHPLFEHEDRDLAAEAWAIVQ